MKKIKPLKLSILEKDLKRILNDHKIWLYSNRKKGNQGNFAGKDISDADLSGSLLVGADFKFSDLTNVNFTNANIWGANLRGANLFGAEYTKDQIDSAITDENTKF